MIGGRDGSDGALARKLTPIHPVRAPFSPLLFVPAVIEATAVADRSVRQFLPIRSYVCAGNSTDRTSAARSVSAITATSSPASSVVPGSGIVNDSRVRP